MIGARTYGTLERRGLKWVIPELEPHVRIRLKQVFPKIPKAAVPPFLLPCDPPTSADLAWFMSRYPLACDDDTAAAVAGGAAEFAQRQAEAERILAPDYRPRGDVRLRPGKALRLHQASNVDLLQLVGGLLVGDDVGEGKTITAIAACMLPGALPATIVMDPHLQGQWKERFEEFTDLSVHIVDSTRPYSLPPADVRLFRWTQLLGWTDVFELIGTGLAAFDEMQELRTGTGTGKGKAALNLVNHSRLRLGLTATPIYNWGVEIWNVMRFLRPEVLGDSESFVREWAPSGHVKDPQALGSFLVEQYAMVRKRKAVDLVRRIVQTVDYDADALASIEELARQLAMTATRGSFTERGEATRELDLRVRQQTGVAKARAVARVARVLIESGEPILLVGWHREVYDIWLQELADLKPAMHTGSETPAKKKREIDRFLSGDTDCLIISLRSGRGVDGLQVRSRYVVFGELDWSKQVMDQVIGRLDRDGSICDGTDDKITALFLVCDDGSDPPMMELVGAKAAESEGIVDHDLPVRKVDRDGSHLRALVERYVQRAKAGASELLNKTQSKPGGAA